MRGLRQYGWRQRDDSLAVGVNARLDELQAAILRVKLKRLEADNAAGRAVAAAYDAAFANLPVGLPTAAEGVVHARHQYVLRVRDREAVRAAMTARGVGSAVHYPIPVHLQSAYAGRIAIGSGGMAVTERLAGEILSLPIFPQMTAVQIERTITAVAEVVGEGSGAARSRGTFCRRPAEVGVRCWLSDPRGAPHALRHPLLQ